MNPSDGGWPTTDGGGRPVEWVLGDLRRQLNWFAERRLIQAADAGGSLSELDAVLRQKRGCRR